MLRACADPRSSGSPSVRELRRLTHHAVLRSRSVTISPMSSRRASGSAAEAGTEDRGNQQELGPTWPPRFDAPDAPAHHAQPLTSCMRIVPTRVVGKRADFPCRLAEHDARDVLDFTDDDPCREGRRLKILNALSPAERRRSCCAESSSRHVTRRRGQVVTGRVILTSSTVAAG